MLYGTTNAVVTDAPTTTSTTTPVKKNTTPSSASASEYNFFNRINFREINFREFFANFALFHEKSNLSLIHI